MHSVCVCVERVCVSVLCGTQTTKLLKLPGETFVALTLPQVDVAVAVSVAPAAVAVADS